MFANSVKALWMIAMVQGIGKVSSTDFSQMKGLSRLKILKLVKLHRGGAEPAWSKAEPAWSNPTLGSESYPNKFPEVNSFFSDPLQLAKVAAAVRLLDATFFRLAPTIGASLVGVDSSPYNEWIVESMGASLLRTSITMLCVLNGYSIAHAIGFGLIPWVAYIMQNVLNGYPTKFGVKPWGQYVLLAINSIFGLMLFSDWKHTDNLINTVAVWYALNAFGLVLMPADTSVIWGYRVDTDVKLLMRLIGFSIMSYSVLITSLNYFQVVSYKSVAYSMIPCALSALTRRNRRHYDRFVKMKRVLSPNNPLFLTGSGSSSVSSNMLSNGDQGEGDLDEDATASFMTAYAVMTSVVAAFILKECNKAQCGI